MVRFARVSVLAVLALSSTSVGAQAGVEDETVWYVDDAATGANNGTSWNDAWTDLQHALASVGGGERIWVAAGTYQPGANRAATFQLVDDVGVYGGFTGTEDPAAFDLNERDFAVNETILGGDIGNAGTADNCFHVVTGSGTGATAVLDGFTITAGHADGATVLNQSVGGGLLNIDGNPTIRNCIFLRNESGSLGGGVHNACGSLTLINCKFIENRSTVSQGTNNKGGGMYSVGVSGTIARPVLINCLFVGNRAGVGGGGSGGALYNDAASSPTLINCTFSRNTADTDGGGIFGSPTLVSCILWGNSDRGGMDRSAQIFGSGSVTYSCVQGGWSGTGNIGDDPLVDDPLFVDPTGDDGVPGTADDNLRLMSGSPCIDAGNNATPISGVALDLDGNPRVVDHPDTPDTGNPPSADAIVDMGVYEFQVACETDAQCNDGDPCTEDRCDLATGRCVHENMDCDDGVFCNGLETCADGACLGGTPLDCDDGVSCTVDTCSEATSSCHNIPDDSLCDNGLYCDGAETCHPELGCQVGVPVDCDDGVSCTVDTCNEATGVCHIVPHDSLCDNGVYCDGAETCDPVLGCQAGVPVDCDDGVACTVDSCNEATDACHHVPDDELCDDGSYCNGVETCDPYNGCMAGDAPCAEGETCNEENDTCDPPPECHVDGDCDDLNPCTDDVCHAGVCEYVNNTAPCDDGDACTADDTCSDGVCIGTPIPGCGEPPPPPPPPPPDPDSDGDGVSDLNDGCPHDPEKVEPGACGCGQADTDTDNDGAADCVDNCPNDPAKNEPGRCGCGNPDIDRDNDGTPDCNDGCPADPNKTVPGHCGCGIADGDSDHDGVPDCDDLCPHTPTGAEVDADGCRIEPSAGQSLPDDDGAQVSDDVNVRPGTTPDEEANEDECSFGTPCDEPATAPARRSCGACGAFGMVSWSLLLLGLITLRSSFIRKSISPHST